MDPGLGNYFGGGPATGIYQRQVHPPRPWSMEGPIFDSLLFAWFSNGFQCFSMGFHPIGIYM